MSNVCGFVYLGRSVLMMFETIGFVLLDKRMIGGSMLWTKVASALEGLNHQIDQSTRMQGFS